MRRQSAASVMALTLLQGHCGLDDVGQSGCPKRRVSAVFDSFDSPQVIYWYIRFCTWEAEGLSPILYTRWYVIFLGPPCDWPQFKPWSSYTGTVCWLTTVCIWKNLQLLRKPLCCLSSNPVTSSMIKSSLHPSAFQVYISYCFRFSETPLPSFSENA